MQGTSEVLQKDGVSGLDEEAAGEQAGKVIMEL